MYNNNTQDLTSSICASHLLVFFLKRIWCLKWCTYNSSTTVVYREEMNISCVTLQVTVGIMGKLLLLGCSLALGTTAGRGWSSKTQLTSLKIIFESSNTLERTQPLVMVVRGTVRHSSRVNTICMQC